MDEDKLKKILSDDHAPEIDVNARKRALNVAMAEFKTTQNEKSEKSSQGFLNLSRLIGMNTDKGENKMERKTKNKFIYGGAATAMAVIFVAGVSLTQLDNTVQRFGEGQGAKTAELNAVQFATDTTDEIAPAYAQAVEQRNEADLESATREGSSAIPVPIETPDTRLEIPTQSDPLAEWRRNQNQRVEREMKTRQTEPAKKQVKDKGKADSDALHRWRRTKVAPQEMAAGAIAEEEMVMDMVAPMAAAPAPMALKEERANLGKTVGKAKSAKLFNMPTRSITLNDDASQPQGYKDVGRDQFEDFKINPFKSVAEEPVSTFSSDVDTASYSFVRRQINNGVLPQKDAVRVEEMVNYFNYNYPLPENKAQPFQPTVTITDSPWAEGKKLMHIGVKGYDLEKNELRSNLVFLLDVSGSMNAPDKLQLVKNSMKLLLDSLHPDDTVSIVVYAGHTGIVLEPTKAAQRNTIISAMNSLRAGGGTAGAAGIELAYNMAEQNFDKGAVNRIILATDGDFNVGISNKEELQDYVERKRDKGIFLSVLGFGQGNYNDHMMQTLAQNGNGIAAYIDNLNEARKVLVQEATSSLFPIAGDVKFQVEFNPAAVAEYRLVGYETRKLNREDFNNDKVDAGDIGAGHTVTAIYEFVPTGSEAVSVDALRYGETKAIKPAEPSSEYAFLKMRYKLPMEKTSKLITRAVTASDVRPPCPPKAQCLVAGPSQDVIFSSAVAAFGQILKGGEHTGEFSYDEIIALAQQGKGKDPFGYRAEFINMVRLAQSLSR